MIVVRVYKVEMPDRGTDAFRKLMDAAIEAGEFDAEADMEQLADTDGLRRAVANHMVDHFTSDAEYAMQVFFMHSEVQEDPEAE
jgi:hypothetical protein